MKRCHPERSEGSVEQKNMTKRLLLFIAAVLCSAALYAQNSEWGGVKGTVVNRAGRAPISQADILLSQKGETVATAKSDAVIILSVEDKPIFLRKLSYSVS